MRRWRNSFLFGLLFGGPTMAVMIYYMLVMPGATACHELHQNDSLIALNGSTAPPAGNVTEAAGADAGCHHMLMIVNGLSLRNLLLFIFCTPCQVSRRCGLVMANFHYASFYIHHCHFLLLSPKADTHFTIPQRVEGWVDLDGWLYTFPRTVTQPVICISIIWICNDVMCRC